jgi:rhodanese-related sulfurtransferase
MITRWILTGALLFSLLCSCKPPGGVPQQDASDRIKEITTSQLQDWIATGQGMALIDVREDSEWQDGHAANAMHIPRLALSGRIRTAAPDKSARIVLYCLGGGRSAAAAATLQRLGYTNVFSLAGGFKQYRRAGLAVQR